MKQLFFLILLLFSLSSVSAQCADLDDSKEIGLIAYLTAIQQCAENKVIWSELVFAQKDSGIPDTARFIVKTQIDRLYGRLKLKVDIFVNQLSADLVNRNSVRMYRKMDKDIRGKSIGNYTKIEKYKSLLSDIEQEYEQLIQLDYRVSNGQEIMTDISDDPSNLDKVLAPIASVFGLAGLNPYTIYKDVQATKQKKIAILVGYLKESRLSPLTELNKPKKEEKKSSGK